MQIRSMKEEREKEDLREISVSTLQVFQSYLDPKLSLDEQHQKEKRTNQVESSFHYQCISCPEQQVSYRATEHAQSPPDQPSYQILLKNNNRTIKTCIL